MVLQLLLSVRTVRGLRTTPALWSHVHDPLKGKAVACRLASGLATVGPMCSVLLVNDDGDMAVVVVVSVQRAKDDSTSTFFSCVQATLWFLLSWPFCELHLL